MLGESVRKQGTRANVLAPERPGQEGVNHLSLKGIKDWKWSQATTKGMTGAAAGGKGILFSITGDTGEKGLGSSRKNCISTEGAGSEKKEGRVRRNLLSEGKQFREDL